MKEQLATVQSNHALLLGAFVNVDPNPQIGVNGPNITFKGANIHIVSGSGSTGDNTGLGNLIIGYDEDPQMFGLAVGSGSPLFPGDRGGSHNLVINVTIERYFIILGTVSGHVVIITQARYYLAGSETCF